MSFFVVHSHGGCDTTGKPSFRGSTKTAQVQFCIRQTNSHITHRFWFVAFKICENVLFEKPELQPTFNGPSNPTTAGS